jgi:predicted aspartyl protease
MLTELNWPTGQAGESPIRRGESGGAVKILLHGRSLIRTRLMRHKTCLAIGAVCAIMATALDIIVSSAWTHAQELKKSAAKPVPFKLAKPDKPLIVLEAVVNGEGPCRFVLDTGASLTIISPELAKKIEARRDEAEKAVGAGGSVEVYFATVKTLEIGETRLEGLKVGIMDLTRISKAIETDIDGIIGYNFLSKFRVSIDYPRQTVTFE